MVTPKGPSSLSGCVVALAGQHTVCAEFSLVSIGDLKKSIADQGGECLPKVTAECTHLVANQKQYDANGAKVKQAANKQHVKIVSYEWLVKSLSSNKKVDESAYLFGATGNATGANGTSSGGSKASKSKKKRKRNDQSDEEDAEDNKAKVSAPQLQRQPSQKKAAVKKPLANVPVDVCSGLHHSHAVYRDQDGTVFDVTLNQTNAGQNNNKFYLIQLLVGLSGQDYRTWTRWGRVGDRGQSAELGSGSFSEALGHFEKKFRDKSGHKWDDRHEPAKKGKYTYIERNYEEEDEDDQSGAPDAHKPPSPQKQPTRSEASKVESKLPKAVQDLVRLIFDQELFNQTMASMNYDAHKMPLGKLSKRTLTQGYQVLKDISAVLGDHSLAQSQYGQSFAQTLEDLSNRYFSTIPHAFGRNRPPVIQDNTLMKKEVELIESLTDMQLANEIMKTAQNDEEKRDVHLVDRQYDGLGIQEMTPLNRMSAEFNNLQDYLIKSAGKTHGIRFNVQEIFRIERQGEAHRFATSPYASIKNSDRRLLWHGSRTTNYGSILSQGLKIAPPNAPVSGYLYGKGVYLADISTKSANYCHVYAKGASGLLLLCEAELGTPPYKVKNVDYEAEQNAKKQGCISTWGVGKTAPKGWKDAACVHPDLKGIKMPDVSAEPGQADEDNAYLQYNEYVVYNVSQIRLRYLLRVQM